MIRWTLNGLSGLAACIAIATPLYADNLPANEDLEFYTIIDQDLESVLFDFGEILDVPVDVDEDLTGRVRRVAGEFTPSEFLYHLSITHEFSWYFDGQVLHVTPVNDDRTILLQLNDVEIDTLQTTLDELGIADTRYPIIAASDQGLARVSGPPRYIELVQETFQAMTGSGTAPRPPRRLMVIQGDETEIIPGGKR
ncbi:hypothetical protein AADZ90_007225 [Aestuariibius sp. 2305UL40-4]|uniref:hypothetical protein n=1 Tax=Aestuariibius violaceus TaxID=3234132 RepID=UPI00345EC8C5